jgi:hypothetical protein
MPIGTWGFFLYKSRCETSRLLMVPSNLFLRNELADISCHASTNSFLTGFSPSSL